MRYAILVAAISTGLPVFTALGAPVNQARMERAIDLRVATGQFMGSVLVAKDGRVLLSKGYGSANVERHIPDSPATKYRLGSVTKQFTAACILLLEERGKLKVDDPVKKYLPDAPAAWDRITLFNLLTHTSGIPNFTAFPDYRSTESTPTTPEQLVARFRDRPLEFAPGSAWDYSNSGYVLLGYLIEKISGESYSDFVSEYIFRPLGMRDSGYDSSSRFIESHAIGYAPGKKGPVAAGYIDMSIPFSAGALYSTTGDLLKWEKGLFGGKLLKPASVEKMVTPFRNHYAFGLSVAKAQDGERVFSHDGGIEGFNTSVSYIPASNAAIIVLANLNGRAADQISADLRHVLLDENVTLISDRKSIDLTETKLDDLVGHFEFPGGAILAVWRDGRRLLTQLPGQPAVEFYPESQGDFFAKVVDAQITFETGAHGRATALVLHQNGRDQAATRMDEAAAKQTTDALEKRIKDQIPRPGSEAALRHLLAGIAADQPDYDQMEPALAEATKVQLPHLTLMLATLGALQSVEFKRVGPGGADSYRLKFEHGDLDARIKLMDDGKIGGAALSPPQ